ncbi:unnamed protein product [Ectocarpus sp. CCAP 1310/34]|nr:unnamed protein product [Ectocarpus sp. CCAP 1310/34]
MGNGAKNKIPRKLLLVDPVPSWGRLGRSKSNMLPVSTYPPQAHRYTVVSKTLTTFVTVCINVKPGCR